MRKRRLFGTKVPSRVPVTPYMILCGMKRHCSGLGVPLAKVVGKCQRMDHPLQVLLVPSRSFCFLASWPSQRQSSCNIHCLVILNCPICDIGAISRLNLTKWMPQHVSEACHIPCSKFYFEEDSIKVHKSHSTSTTHV